MAGVLYLYTDAAIHGRWLHGWGERSRVGPSFIAWAGWHGTEFPGCPTFAGQGFVGHQGTQRAEYHAVLQGLSASLAYAAPLSPSERPQILRVCVDNAPVQRLIVGTDTARDLRPHFETMKRMTAALRDLGMEVYARKVSEDHEVHKVAHQMSKQANNQVLIKTEWRPVDDKPPRKKRKKGRPPASQPKPRDLGDNAPTPEATVPDGRSSGVTAADTTALPSWIDPADFSPPPRSDVPVGVADFLPPSDGDIPF